MIALVSIMVREPSVRMGDRPSGWIERRSEPAKRVTGSRL